MVVPWKRLTLIVIPVAVSAALMAVVLIDDGETEAAAALPASESEPATGAIEQPEEEPGGSEEGASPAAAAPAEELAAQTTEELAAETGEDGVEPDYRDPVTLQGQRASGLYFNAVFLRRHGARGVLRTLQRAHLDAAVIDVKDAGGRIGHQTEIEILKPQVEGYLGDAPEFVAQLKREGIYTIARVTCFADPQLPLRHPEHSIQDARPRRRGEAWTSWGTAGTWLDPYSPHNHQLVIDLVEEVAGLGFDEIQLDYIRFPVDDGTELAIYPHQTDQPRDELLLGLLRRIDAAIQVPLSVDVFGLTAFRDGDPPELGQHLERWTAHVEIISPMIYLNAMRNWMRGRQDREYALLYEGLTNLRRRLGDEAVIRPWIQGFRKGADYWSPRLITRQIQAVRAADSDGFLFWHPGSSYTMVQRSTAGPARSLSPFPIEQRAAIRERAWNADPTGAARAEATAHDTGQAQR